MIDNNTASDNPTKPYELPKTAINTSSEEILIIAEYPILVDSFDCNLALKIAEIVRGIMEKPKICRLNVPSEYFGKRVSTSKGATVIINTAKSTDIEMAR